MARRKSRRLRFLWLGWGAVSAPVKLVALGLVAVLVGGVSADGLLGLPAAGGPGYAHGPAQRWVSASSADARTAANASRNRTLPDTLRSRYPAVKWEQNAGSVGTPSAPETTGFDPATSRELPEARTATDRTYANTDGTETTEFSTVPVNYRTPQGWAPIDTTLTADGGSGWRNTADAAGLRFAPTSAGQFATMTVSSPDAGQVSFGLDGASAVNGTVSGSAITYPGVRPHVDLKLEAKPGGVKETLVLGSSEAPTSYVFPLRLDGLTPHLDHGQVLLADASGATKAVIPAGDMLDAGAARSAGVTYRLVTSGGGPALEVTLDAGWLRDPARQYPVQVDPTVQLPVNGGAADDAMYVQEGAGSAKGDQDLLAGTVNGHNSASYLKFSNLVGKLQYHTIFGAQLWLTEYNSDSCKPRELTVHPVTGSWSGGSGYSYPGPAVGGSLASKSFAHGYIAFGHSSSDCPTAGETINLGAAGRDLVQRWVDGTQANYGLSLRGSTDSLSGKWFTGTATANPPKLYVTHSPYNATYSIPNPVPNPAVLQNQDGKIKVSVTNKSAAAWAPGDYYLAYRAYNTATGASVTQQRSANLTSTVARGGRVTLDATIKALPPGKYFLDFTMVKTGGPVFTDHQVPPGRLVLQVFDIPPVVQELYPFNGYQAQTLTPQLWARALDIDAPPGSSLQFKFQVCLRDDSGNPVSCTDSGYQAKQAWTVPAGTLSWTKAYLWRAYVKDAGNEVNSPYSTILTSVPQPDITSHLAGDQKQAFDPVVGNYRTAAVDATIVTVGPQLSLSRTYNSLDPRRDGLFGAGWSTTYDMKLVPDNDGSGNVVVTYPDGQQVRFGKNADGSYAAPAGRTASLTVDSTSWKLLDKSGTTYQFSPAGRLSRMTDNAGHAVVLAYDTNTGKLSKAQVSASVTNTAGRALNFFWTGNHVSSIQTDAVNGAPLSWAYTYTGDVLKTVCGPGNTCTSYDYTAGSHYRSAVLDSHPESYWRLGEPDGTSAASEISVNLGKDVGTYANVTLGTAGPLAGSTDTAASFNGTTSSVNLPKGTLKKSRDAAVELWFKNSPTGSGGPLLGYQDKALGTASTTGVPVLYVGTDGKLRGQFATGSITPITSATAVNDGKWHQVVLSSMGTTQTLYLDGAKVGDLTGKQIDASLLTFNQVGAAYATTPASWPSWGTTAQRSYTGAIDDVSLYSGPLGAAIVSAHYKAGTTAADQLAKVTLPSGKVVASVTYDVVRDRVKEYTDHNGGTWKLGTPTVYGGDTDLRRSVEVLDPANRPSLYEYDAIGGWLLRQGKPLGIEARGEDTPGEPAETPPPPVESCTQPDPNDPAFCTTIPGGSGGPVFVRYDADGVSIRTYGYDTNGNLATVTDENGDSTSMTYDARGDVISTTTCRAVNDCQTSRTTYPATIANSYDPKSYLPTESRDARSASATDNTYRTTYAYHSTGQLATQTSPDGSQIVNTYTSGAEAASGGGNVPAGLPATTTDARGKVTRYAYYANGDLAQVTAPSGLVTQYTYDAIGRTTTKKEISDSFPGGVVTTYSYDGWSRPATVTEPATTDAVTGVKHQRQTTTTYDADGDPTRVQVADIGGGGDPARVTTTDYDEHDRPVRVTDPDGNETSSGYDQFGNLTSVTDPNGNHYDYAYTARNSVAEVRLRNWHSDPAGAPPTGTGDYLVLQAYSYDFAGRLASSTDAMGRRTEYQRYGDGLLHRAVLKNFHNADGSTKDYVLEDDSYDAAGHLTKQVTGNGTTVTQHTPDRNGRPLSTVVDPGGLARTTGFTYDPAGNVTRVAVSGNASNVPWIVSATPATTDYTYDDAGNRLTMTTTDGTTSRTTTYAYDQRGLPTAVTDPRGNVAGADKAAFTSRLSYDELGRSTGGTGPVRQVESGGNPASPVAPATKVGYNTFGETVELTDELNNTTHVAYDNAGRMTSRTAPSYLPPGAGQALTPTTRYGYDANGNVTTVTDPRGNTIRSNYDQLDRTVSVDAPSSTNDERAVTSYTYSRTGAVLSIVDPTGARSESTYDDLDRQATGTQVERRPVPAAYTTLIRHDDAGNVVGQTSPTGATTVNGYDAVGELTTTTDPSGIPAQYGYDFAGRQVRATDGLGRTSQTGYDLLGQVVAAADLKPDGTTLRTSHYGYDLAGNRTSVTDALQATTTFAYDAANQLVSQVEPVDAKTSITSSFGYDAAGNMTRFTDGRGNATITTYNSLGLVESTIEPATAAQPNAVDRTWTTGFDENGNAVRDVAPGGVVQQVTYDAANRPTDGTATGAETPTTPRHLGYDLAGRAVGTNAGAGTNSYVYNDRGNLLSSTGPSGTAAFTYDGDGNRTSRADAAGTTNFGYVKARLDSVTDGLTGVKEQLGYDGAGKVKTVGYGAGRVRTFTYDDFGRVATDVLTNSAAKQVASTTYHYDLDNRLSDKTTAGTAGAGTVSYKYDQSGRLTSDTTGGVTTGYEWDAAGNRTKTGPATATYDERNRLLTAGGTSYTYTARGTLASQAGSGGTAQFGYDGFDRLTSAAGQTYSYDGFDRVDSRNGTAFTYAGQDSDPVSDGSETYARGSGGELLAVRSGGANRLALSDRHDDVVGAFDPADTALSGLSGSTAYGPFGQVTAHTGTTGNLGYQGDWTDPGTGRVDMGARWYDPGTGSFGSRDSMSLSPTPSSNGNRYLYGNADPVNSTDPTGHWGFKFSSFDVVVQGLKMLYRIETPTRMADDSCEAYYGMSCAAFFRSAHKESVHDMFCDTHSWTSQCGGSGRWPYSSGGGGGGSYGGGGGHGGGGGGGGGSYVDWAKKAAEEAAEAAYRRALRITEEARDAAEHAAKTVTIAVGAAATTAVTNLPTLVSSAPTAAAAVVSTVENVVTDTKVQAKNIYQAAVDAAGVVVIAVSTASQVNTEPENKTQNKSRQGQDCRRQFPEPFYFERDSSNGDRAVGVIACVTRADLREGTGTSSEIRPPGYQWAGTFVKAIGGGSPGSWVNNCHSLASLLGGSGTDLRNLSTCSRTTNANRIDKNDRDHSPNMRWFEDQTAKQLETGKVDYVLYTVIQHYHGPRTVPYEYDMDAKGADVQTGNTFSLHKPIENKVWSPKYHKWMNMGEGIKDGRPVPVGSTP